MKKLTLFLTVVFISIVFIMPAHSVLKKTAQTGLQFLKVDVGARAAAMGGAFMMVGKDANAIFYNPAGIAAMSSTTDIFISRTEWIADIKYNAVAAVQNFGNWGNAGISYISSDYGNMIGTQVSATADKGFIETGNLNVGAYAVGLAYSRQFTDKFTVGGQVKYASQHLGSSVLSVGGQTVDNKVSGLAYDFGTIFYPGFRSFRLGMDIRNFSPQFKYQKTAFELPLTLTLGFSMDIFDFLQFLQEKGQSLVLEIDAAHPRDYTERLNIGGEYWFKDMIALRAGYKFNYDEESLSAGFGVKYTIDGFDIKFDYSYSDLGIFDAVSRISFGVTF